MLITGWIMKPLTVSITPRSQTDPAADQATSVHPARLSDAPLTQQVPLLMHVMTSVSESRVTAAGRRPLSRTLTVASTENFFEAKCTDQEKEPRSKHKQTQREPKGPDGT